MTVSVLDRDLLVLLNVLGVSDSPLVVQQKAVREYVVQSNLAPESIGILERHGFLLDEFQKHYPVVNLDAEPTGYDWLKPRGRVQKHYPGGKSHDQSTHGNWADGKSTTATPTVPVWQQTRDSYEGKYEDLGLEGLDKDERSKRLEAHWERGREWSHEVRKALARGDLLPEEARKLGWHPTGHDSPENPGGGWQPLPDDLFHVTTAASSVRESGLKTRDELNQGLGLGLGGGESDTISFSADPEIAQSIYRGIQEMRQVAKGDITLANLLEKARTGSDASRPYIEDVIQYASNKRDWSASDPFPSYIQGFLDGYKYQDTPEFVDSIEKFREWYQYHSYSSGKMTDEELSLWEKVKDSPRDKPRYRRKYSDDEIREETVSIYKNLTLFREAAGGPYDPMFFTSNTKALGRTDPKEIRILKFKPKKKGRSAGYPLNSMGEWRTTTGEAVEFVEEVEPANA